MSAGQGADHGPIDFAELAAALLERAEQLVAKWLPGGKRVAGEWVCGGLEGGEGGSCSVNLVSGRWAEFNGDESGKDLISLYAAIHGLNNVQAARQLMADLGWTRGRSMPQRTGVQASAPRRSAEPPEPEERPGKRRSVWRAIVPVPGHAPGPSFSHFQRGLPERTWEYRFGDQLHGYVCRFRTSDGGKEILPLTWCVDESDDRGTQKWQWKQWEEPRPLYVPATLLAADSRLVPVVLVEGEKCAQAGLELLGHEFDFVSWPGGGKAWAKADWTWLRGRVVILWPDCDAKRERLTPAERDAGVDPNSKPLQPESKQPGVKAMVSIGSVLQASMGCTVSWCPIPAPGAVADGWDLADAIEQGWDAEQVRAFLRGARAFEAPDDAARAKARPTPAAAGASDEEAARLAWRSKLLTSMKGSVLGVRENVALALNGLPDEGLAGIPECERVVAFNEFTKDIVKLKPAPWGTPEGVWEDEDDLMMGQWLVRTHWLPSMARSTLEEGVRIAARSRQYHPVREWLQTLVWDGEKRLSTWLRRACLEEDEWDDKAPLQRYLARVGTFFLMGMVARVLPTRREHGQVVCGPGTKFDYMLILEGAQGMRKSTLLRTLAGEYFADTGLVLGDKDSFQQLQGRWLYEIGELDAFSKADINKIKQYVASQFDYYRGSYDRRASDHPRQMVFAGTTNEDHYLTDPTGNRRFWPVRVTRLVDIDWVIEHRNQLFAEAMHRVQAGGRMYPTPQEELELFAPQQNARAVENAIEVAIARWLYDNQDGLITEEITLVELLGKVGIDVSKLGPGRYHEKQAAAALRRLGWAEARSSRPGRPRVYRRPKLSPAAAGAEPGPIHGPTQGTDGEDPNGNPF